MNSTQLLQEICPHMIYCVFMTCIEPETTNPPQITVGFRHVSNQQSSLISLAVKMNIWIICSAMWLQTNCVVSSITLEFDIDYLHYVISKYHFRALIASFELS
jgi:hypothetical protein